MTRLAEHPREKRAIGRRAAALFGPGDTLFVDTGTTSVVFAEELARRGGLTVVTNCLTIAQLVGGSGNGNRSFMIGGEYRDAAAQTLGALAVEQIARFHAAHAVLTVGAHRSGRRHGLRPRRDRGGTGDDRSGADRHRHRRFLEARPTRPLRGLPARPDRPPGRRSRRPTASWPRPCKRRGSRSSWPSRMRRRADRYGSRSHRFGAAARQRGNRRRGVAVSATGTIRGGRPAISSTSLRRMVSNSWLGLGDRDDERARAADHAVTIVRGQIGRADGRLQRRTQGNRQAVDHDPSGDHRVARPAPPGRRHCWRRRRRRRSPGAGPHSRCPGTATPRRSARRRSRCRGTARSGPPRGRPRSRRRRRRPLPTSRAGSSPAISGRPIRRRPRRSDRRARSEWQSTTSGCVNAST